MFFYQDSEAKANVAIGRAKSALGSPIYQELRSFLSENWMKRVRNTSAVGTIKGKDSVYQNHLR